MNKEYTYEFGNPLHCIQSHARLFLPQFKNIQHISFYFVFVTSIVRERQSIQESSSQKLYYSTIALYYSTILVSLVLSFFFYCCIHMSIFFSFIPSSSMNILLVFP